MDAQVMEARIERFFRLAERMALVGEHDLAVVAAASAVEAIIKLELLGASDGKGFTALCDRCQSVTGRRVRGRLGRLGLCDLALLAVSLELLPLSAEDGLQALAEARNRVLHASCDAPEATEQEAELALDWARWVLVALGRKPIDATPRWELTDRGTALAVA